MPKELKMAQERFRRISIAHDLTMHLMEIIKAVRRKALDELEREKEGEDEGASSVGNYRIIVVGQQMMKPTAVKVPIRN